MRIRSEGSPLFQFMNQHARDRLLILIGICVSELGPAEVLLSDFVSWIQFGRHRGDVWPDA
jgi:hypothetical protein